MVPLVAVVLIAILALPLSIRAEEAPRLVALDAGQMRSLGIVTAPLPTGEARLGRRLPARVVVPPAQIRVVAAPLAGMVEQVAVASQQSVRAGQLMARLTSPMLLEAQRDYLTAASELQLAESNSRRDEQLYREGIIGEARLRATQNSEAQAAATAAQRRQVLRLYGMTPAAISALAKSRSLSPVIDLAAPITGVVLERMAEPGQRVEANTPLFRLASLKPLWLEMQASLEEARALRPGAAVTASGARGRVVTVGAAVDGASQSVPVRAEMSEGLESLRPGQFVEAQVTLAAGPRVYRLPAGALAREQGRAHVFLQSPQGFVMTPVTVVEESAGEVLVSGALREGARIVVKGVAALKAAANPQGQ